MSSLHLKFAGCNVQSLPYKFLKAEHCVGFFFFCLIFVLCKGLKAFETWKIKLTSCGQKAWIMIQKNFPSTVTKTSQ